MAMDPEVGMLHAVDQWTDGIVLAALQCTCRHVVMHDSCDNWVL